MSRTSEFILYVGENDLSIPALMDMTREEAVMHADNLEKMCIGITKMPSGLYKEHSTGNMYNAYEFIASLLPIADGVRLWNEIYSKMESLDCDFSREKIYHRHIVWN